MSSERHVNHHPSESCTGACPSNQRGGLDIDALRLTEDELDTAAQAWDGTGSTPMHHLADAQLAKAAYGFLDWLEHDRPDQHYVVMRLGVLFLEALEQANIERPMRAKEAV